LKTIFTNLSGSLIANGHASKIQAIKKYLYI